MKQFMLSDKSVLYSGTRLIVAGSDKSLPCLERFNGCFSDPSPSSRRDFLKVAGIGVGTAIGLGACTRQAKAEPITLVSCMVTFLIGVFAGVVTDLVLSRIRRSDWYRRDLTDATPDERYHFAYAPPDITNTTVEPIESQRYPGCHFDLNQVGRFAGGRNLDRFKDLNAPEYRRLVDELRADGPYRFVADPRRSMRRQLTQRDLDLFHATLRLYAADSAVPAASEIVPEYARELCDSRGQRYTGFGLSLRSGGKNFLMGNTSSV